MTLDELRPSLDDVLPAHLDADDFASFVRELNALADAGRWADVVRVVDDILELGEGVNVEYLRAAILVGSRFWVLLGRYASMLRLQYRKTQATDPGLALHRFIKRTHAALGLFGERRRGRPRTRLQ